MTITSEFSEVIKVKIGMKYLKVLIEKQIRDQSRILYPVNLQFKSEETF